MLSFRSYSPYSSVRQYFASGSKNRAMLSSNLKSKMWVAEPNLFLAAYIGIYTR